MIKELRLKWEPDNSTPLKEIEDRMISYTKGRGSITVLGNGTLLSLTDGGDPIADAKQALNEARFIVDFHVIPLKEGGYMVAFHKAVAVFVGEEEFKNRKVEIEARQSELRFPGERLISPPETPADHVLIGLYARGKLQYDAYHFSFYKKL